MRAMCTYEHGIRDHVKIIRDDDIKWFNEMLEKHMAAGWRIIQPIDTIEQVGSNWAKIVHVAVLARPWDDE